MWHFNPENHFIFVLLIYNNIIEILIYCRAAINLTSRLLTIYGQGRGRSGFQTKHSPHSLQLWFTRIALLVKTKAFNVAQAEAEPFGQLDKPDIYYQVSTNVQLKVRIMVIIPFLFTVLSGNV